MRKLILLALLGSAAMTSFGQSTSYGTNAGNGNLGTQNASFGYNAGATQNASSQFNAIFGAFGGQYISSGHSNTVIGYAAGLNITTGYRNVLLGRAAGAGMPSSTGYDNVFGGYFSGRTLTTGFKNVALGTNSMFNVSSGSSNTVLGDNAGFNVTTGTGNVLIGASAGYYETGSNKLYIDNTDTSTPLISGDFSTNQVGINALPGSYTLNVGGTINATAVLVNGMPIGSGSGGSQWITNGSNINFLAGAVSIGTSATPAGYRLAVGGKAIAEEVMVQLQSSWPDYVFEPTYKRRTLDEVEQFINTNKHLPEVPSAKEIQQNGLNLGEMDATIMKKVEELTLYMIELKKEVDQLKVENEQLKSQLKKD